MRYRLVCPKCQTAHPVEVGQAGGTVSCQCGEKIAIPTMLKIKRLEPWDDQDASDSPEQAPKGQSNASTDAQSHDGASTEKKNAKSDGSAKTDVTKKTKKGSGKRGGVIIVCSILLLGSLTMCIGRLQPTNPRAVFYKQTNYSLDGDKRIRRDSTPITPMDYGFYYFTDLSNPQRPLTYYIDDNLIDNMSLFAAYNFFEYCRELDLSDNFYENYQMIKTKRLLSAIAYGVVALLSLCGLLFGIFHKESTKQVGTMRGSEWR
ncbi:MAG: hypothetical protein Q4G03_05125 [Planctomycetia bacterium]|nr:hypothetical protein [Planctomycetia bacterium]